MGNVPAGATASLLGAEGPLRWEAAGTRFVREVPEPLRGNPPAIAGSVARRTEHTTLA